MVVVVAWATSAMLFRRRAAKKGVVACVVNMCANRLVKSGCAVNRAGTVNMVLRNPGGEHLSSDMANLPGIYDSLTVFWAIIIGYVTLTCVRGSEKSWARGRATALPQIAALSRGCVHVFLLYVKG